MNKWPGGFAVRLSVRCGTSDVQKARPSNEYDNRFGPRVSSSLCGANGVCVSV